MVVLALIASQGISLWQIMKLREFADQNSHFQLGVLLKHAEEERYKYPVIDVTQNRVYIPEARIYLPLNETSRNLRYDYREKGAGSWSRAMHFSTSSVVGQQSDERHANCDKIVTLAPPAEFQQLDDGADGTIEPTKDGFKYVFVHSDDACWDQKWYAGLKEGLLEAVKQAKSY